MELKKFDYFLFTVFLYATLIVDLIRQASDVIISLPEGFINLLRNTIYIGVFLLIIFRLAKHDKSFLLRYCTVAIIFFSILAVSLLIENRLISLYTDFVLKYFSRLSIAFIIGYYISDWDKFFNIYFKFIWIPMLYALFIFLFPASFIEGKYYMTAAYNVLPHCICCFAYALIKHKPIIYIPFLILFFVLFLGARGALLGGLFAIIMTFVLYDGISRKVKLRFGLCLVLLLMAIIPNIEGISKYLAEHDIKSHALQMVLSKDGFFDNNGRDSYYGVGVSNLLDSPWTMRGYGGNIIMYQDSMGKEMEGTYAHNAFLEFLLDYGLVFGGILSLLFIIGILYSFRVVLSLQSDIKIFYLAYFIALLLPLMVSQSYTSSYMIWIFAGVMLNTIKQRNNLILSEATSHS